MTGDYPPGGADSAREPRTAPSAGTGSPEPGESLSAPFFQQAHQYQDVMQLAPGETPVVLHLDEVPLALAADQVVQRRIRQLAAAAARDTLLPLRLQYPTIAGYLAARRREIIPPGTVWRMGEDGVAVPEPASALPSAVVAMSQALAESAAQGLRDMAEAYRLVSAYWDELTGMQVYRARGYGKTSEAKQIAAYSALSGQHVHEAGEHGTHCVSGECDGGRPGQGEPAQRGPRWLIAPPGTRPDEPGWHEPPPGLALTWAIDGERPPYAVLRDGVLVSTGLPLSSPNEFWRSMEHSDEDTTGQDGPSACAEGRCGHEERHEQP